MSTDRPAYATGETVTFTLSVTNPTDESLTLASGSGQQYDFIVQDVPGAEVWCWSHGRFFTQALTSLTLQPRETRTFTEWWDQRSNAGQQVSPGMYTVTGVLTTIPNQRRTDPVDFTIGGQTPPAGGTEMVPLVAGCTNVALTWPDGTPTGAVARAITPPQALLAIWRYDSARQRFQAFSPQAPQASDLLTVNALDAVFICMSAPGTLTRPAP